MQKTAYEMRISNLSSDVCSSDLRIRVRHNVCAEEDDEVLGINGITDCYRDNLNAVALDVGLVVVVVFNFISAFVHLAVTEEEQPVDGIRKSGDGVVVAQIVTVAAEHRIERSEEHTSELQSLMRISYAVFCLKKK